MRHVLTQGRGILGRGFLGRGFLGGAGLLVATLLLGARSRPSPTDTAPADANASLTVEVQRPIAADAYQEFRSFSGTVQARRTSNLSFRRTAEVTALSVDQGDRVAQGQTLAHIDIRQREAARDGLKAQRSEAQAKLDELLAGPRVESIRAQKSRVAELAAQAARLESQKKRRARLREQRVISEEEFEETTFDLQATRARWQAAEHLLSELETGTRVEQIDAQRAVVKQLDAEVAQVEIELHDSTLIAPFTGWVTRRLVDEGVIISAGQTVLQLVEAEPWEVWLGIPPELSSQIEIGMACDVQIGNQVYPACVRRLLTQLDSDTRTRTVILTLAEDTGQRVVPGQLARVQFPQTVDATGYWVPLTSLTRGTGGLWALLVANPIDNSGHRISRQLVEVLHTDGEQAFVRGAIQPTDFVVSRGAHRLALNQIVTIRDTTPGSHAQR